MVISNFVYFIKSEKRLIITNNSIDDKEYLELMNTSVEYSLTNQALLYNQSKLFCIGYIMGSKCYDKPVNKIEEFK